jgi:hypothetical protein
MQAQARFDRFGRLVSFASSASATDPGAEDVVIVVATAGGIVAMEADSATTSVVDLRATREVSIIRADM